MNIKIHIKKNLPVNENQIVICKENDYINLKLAENQKNFIINQSNKETKVIEINNYDHFIYIINPKFDFKNNKSEFYRTAGNEIITLLNKNKQNRIIVNDLLNEKENIFSLLEGIVLGNYRFIKYYKDNSEFRSTLEEIILNNSDIKQTEIDSLLNILQSVYIARDLGNEPYSYLNSLQLSHEIMHIGKESGFDVQVLNKQDIKSEGMGGLLAVNKASDIPATFSILEWKPDNALNIKPIVLVGKGIVYDSGGYSIKPTKNSMDMMKMDMAGASVVIGVFNTLSLNKTPLHVIGLIPATDNAVDAKSYVPGDIIKMHNGMFVEVLNTDAEGRLILADALSYAKKFNPELVIDIATLTGSAANAIGSEASVVMGTAEASIFNKLKLSGDNVYERIVQFPFWDEYKEMLKSNVADIKNIGGGEAGAITAGKFLEYFIDYPWIHIDIAGPGMIEKKRSYISAGASGYGVRLIVEFLRLKVLEDYR